MVYFKVNAKRLAELTPRETKLGHIWVAQKNPFIKATPRAGTKTRSAGKGQFFELRDSVLCFFEIFTAKACHPFSRGLKTVATLLLLPR